MARDVDIVCPMAPENLGRIHKSLESFHPVHRVGSPGDWKNVYLRTDLGVLDCLGEVAGLGDYRACLERSVTLDLGDYAIKLLSLEALIDAKRAMGRSRSQKKCQTLAAARTPSAPPPPSPRRPASARETFPARRGGAELRTALEFMNQVKKPNRTIHAGIVAAILGLCVCPLLADPPENSVPRTNSKGKQLLPAGAKVLKIGERKGFLALPENTKPGQKTPWLWYLPSDYNLPGKLEQWMLDQCLANGIAVAGIDLSGDFGTPAGRANLTAFYQEVTRNHGLTTKACMLARSYGVLQMFNWADEHPESVACLAGIYPVCNMASYPGLKSAAGKYGMSQEQLTKELKQHNPIDRLAPLAKAKVPIYHNTGDVDTLVPAKDNSFLVEKRYKALGGPMTVTIFEGQGHNYWTGFFEDEAMAAFIIKHAKKAASIPKVLIFGDSISGGYSKPLIELLDGKAEVVKLGAVAGYRIQKETFWHSRGIAKNLDFGSAKACIVDFERFERHLKETKYDVIHFNFGLNDIFRGRNGAWHNPPAQYAKDLTKIVTLLKTNGAKVIWATTTPIPANAPHNPEGDDLIYNAAAEKVMKEKGIPINDLHRLVTKWDGYAKWKKGDDVHFPAAVYSNLAEQIAEKILAQLGTSED